MGSIMLLETSESFYTKKGKESIEICCDHCKKTSSISKQKYLLKKYKAFKKEFSITELKKDYDKLSETKDFCDNRCQGDYVKDRNGAWETITCKECGAKKEALKKGEVQFCSQSCATLYNNKNKTYGLNRSKLELWLERVLSECFDVEIHFNRKDAIRGELDIYFPELKLAFELNGIFHYEPIFGEERLNKCQSNDERKFQACIENGIELCIIDTSGQTRFTPESSIKFLEIILKILSGKGVEPKVDPIEYGLSVTVDKENLLIKNKPKLNPRKKCLVCGNEFSQRHSKHRFCSHKCGRHYHYKTEPKYKILEKNGVTKKVNVCQTSSYLKYGWKVKSNP